jgi:hypothetical protein
LEPNHRNPERKQPFSKFPELNHHSQREKTTTTSRVIIAIVITLALLGVVAITIITIQVVEAGCERGGASGTAFNASKGRCFRL